MTRFKEGRRIEAALKHCNLEELDWAESYCKSRLEIATRKDHQKHWSSMLKKIESKRVSIDT